MITICKRGSVYLAKGIQKYKTFRSQVDATEWAAHTESSILNKDIGKVAKDLTFGDLVGRYREEVTPDKRGSRSGILRLNRIKKCKIASVTVENLAPEHFTEWRDDWLHEVNAASVRRELGTMFVLCTHTMREWGVMRSSPPVV